MDESLPHQMVNISSYLLQAASMAVRSAAVAAAVTTGVGRSALRRALGYWASIPVYGMSVPITATTGSVFGPCGRNN